MNDAVINQIIEDSQALLKVAESAIAAQERLAEIEPQLLSKTAELEYAYSEIQKTAELAADFFIENKFLTKEKRAGFVDSLVQNPSELFGAIKVYTDAISAREPGSPGSYKAASASNVDPIAAFAMS